MKTVTINEKDYPVYATLEDANEYFAGFFNSGWESISDDEKLQLLVSATRSIDRVAYAGERVEENQQLKFPRIIYGNLTNDNILKEACCEEALSIYESNTATSSDITDVKTMKVQDTWIEFYDGRKDKQLKSENAYRLLYPYLEFGVEVGYC